MKLEELLGFNAIVIQCHNEPDADAIASGWAVQRWLESRGKKARLIYGGPNSIQKANLRLMIKLLNIPIEHVPDELAPEPDLLLIVDGTYKSDKVQFFSTKKKVAAAVIDHHQHNAMEQSNLPDLHEVRKDYGSCSTIIWDMMNEAGMDAAQDKELATALYYGLFMDTHRLEDKLHDKDRDMRNALESRCIADIFNEMRYNNLSQKEMKLVGRAMAGARYDMENKFSLAEAEPCDPNILGVIGDQMMEVEDTDVCVTYCLQEPGAKLSVRSCTWQVYANSLAELLTDHRGGGHRDKAGGTILRSLYSNQDHALEGDGDRVFDYLWRELKDFFSRQKIKLPVKAEVDPSQAKDNLLATARITLAGCFTVEGVRVMKGENGRFVSMPRAMGKRDKYYNICYPATAGMRKAINDAVMREYKRALGEEAEEPLDLEPDTVPGELEMDVRVYPVKDADKLLAYASVQLGNCFVVKDIRVRTGPYGIYPAMPSWKDSKGEYHDVCFPAAELKKRLREAILAGYDKAVNDQQT